MPGATVNVPLAADSFFLEEGADGSDAPPLVFGSSSASVAILNRIACLWHSQLIRAAPDRRARRAP